MIFDSTTLVKRMTTKRARALLDVEKNGLSVPSGLHFRACEKLNLCPYCMEGTWEPHCLCDQWRKEAQEAVDGLYGGWKRMSKLYALAGGRKEK